jgi:hypothetical protein
LSRRLRFDCFENSLSPTEPMLNDFRMVYYAASALNAEVLLGGSKRGCFVLKGLPARAPFDAFDALPAHLLCA